MLKKILTVVLLLSCSLILSQEFKLGKLKAQQFDISSPLEQDAPAIFLKKERYSEFIIEDWEKGWFIKKTVHNVVKILKKDGLDYGTISIDLFKSGGNKERVKAIEGYTYEMVGGKLEKTKLSKESVFETELNNDFDRVSFALPNVKEGVILEYSYEVLSPFWKIDDLVFQEDIPVIAYQAIIKVPEVFTFNTYYQGKYRCEHEATVNKKSFNFSYSQTNGFGGKTQRTKFANMKVSEIMHSFVKKDIPPLKEEVFANNLENFRSSIIFELASTEITQGNKKDYTTSWEKVAQSLNNSERFGKPLLKTNFLKEEGNRFRESKLNKKERVSSIFEFVKKQIIWDGNYRSRVERSLKKAYESRAGSSAEVNLLLVALLRESGITAHPVLSATKDYKVPVFPTLEGFNHILAAVNLQEEMILLDATEAFAKPGQLSENVHNWEGRLVRPDGTSQRINLFSKNHVQRQTMINVTLSDEAEASGLFRERIKGDNEIAFRKNNSKMPSTQQQSYYGELYNLEELTDFSLQSDLSEEAEVSYAFNSQDLVEEINGKWYINPLLFLSQKENPFKASTRETPIDFKFPFIERSIISITIPDTYLLQQTPEPTKLVMQDNLGEYTLNISQNGNLIQVMSIFKVNTTLFPPSEYETIQSFYNQMLELQSTPLVLTKK